MTAPGHTPGASAPAVHQAIAARGSVAVSATAAAQQAGIVTPPAPPAARVLHRAFAGRPVLRRVVFVAGYEGLSVFCTVLVLSGLLGHGGGNSTVTAILLSTVATGWNYLWNTIFEAFERRRHVKGRGAAARALHAVGYEGGVLLFTIPLVAFMLHVGFVEALLIESSMLVFFLVFTVGYTWVFDRVFGLPDSAR